MLGLIVVFQAMASLGSAVIGPLGPFIHNDWGLSRAEIGLLQSAMYLGTIGLSILVGWLVDLFGVRRMVLVGMGLMGGLMSFVHWAGSPLAISSLFFLAGIGYGSVGSLTNKAVMTWFSNEFRATAMSIKQMGVTFGQSIAALVLPSLALLLGWRTSISMVGVALVATALLIFTFYREKGGAEKKKVAELPRWSELAHLTTAHPDLMSIYIVSTVYSSVQATLTVYLPLYANQVLKLPAVTAGGLLAVMLISGTLGRPMWGFLSDKGLGGERLRLLYSLGFAASIFGFALTFLGTGANMALVYPVVALLGLTMAGWNGIFMVSISEIAGVRLTGFLTGFSMTLTNLGMILLPPFCGWLIDITGSWGNPLRLMMLLPTLAALVAVTVRRRRLVGYATKLEEGGLLTDGK